jgi:uncharacterized protein (UPF0335 family)
MPKPQLNTPPPAGHNSLDREKLRSLVERIERIEEERAGLAGDIREIYTEAKSAGFDVRAIRTNVRLRRQDQEKHTVLQAKACGFLGEPGS